MAADPAETIEIPVWIGDKQKWVTGLNRKTTCHDIIYLLLGYIGAQDDDVAKYAIYENWRGVERPLAGRTKLGKVWKAYGMDCENVILTVRQFDLDTSCEVSHCKPRIHHRSSKRRGSRTELIERQSSKTSLVQKQYNQTGLKERQMNKEVIPERYSSRNHLSDCRTAFGSCDMYSSRKQLVDKPQKPFKVTLPPQHKRTRTSEGLKERKGNIMTSCHPGSIKSVQCMRYPREEISSTYEDIYSRRSRSKKESRERTSRSLPRDSRQKRVRHDKKHKDKKIQKIFQLIVSQERKIREQLEKLRSVDDQLATQEAKRHEDMEQTLPELQEVDPNPELFPKIKSSDLDAYSHMCNSIIEIQTKLHQEQNRIQELSTIIHEETVVEQSTKGGLQVETLTESQIIGPKAGNFISNDVKIQEEIEKLRKELDRASELGKSQQTEIDSIANSIAECDRYLEAKAKIVNKLEGELKEMEDNEEISPVDNDVDNREENDRVDGHKESVQPSSCIQQKPAPMHCLRDTNSAPQTPFQTLKPNQMSSSHENVEKHVTYNGNVDAKGQSVDGDEMCELTIVSDFNSTWEEDTFIVSNDDVTKVAGKDGHKLLPMGDDLKKSPSGESSSSSGFSELSPIEEEKISKRSKGWYKKTFPFPSYDTMKNLRFDCSRKMSEGSESGTSSLYEEDQHTQETLV